MENSEYSESYRQSLQPSVMASGNGQSLYRSGVLRMYKWPQKGTRKSGHGWRTIVLIRQPSSWQHELKCPQGVDIGRFKVLNALTVYMAIVMRWPSQGQVSCQWCGLKVMPDIVRLRLRPRSVPSIEGQSPSGDSSRRPPPRNVEQGSTTLTLSG